NDNDNNDGKEEEGKDKDQIAHNIEHEKKDRSNTPNNGRQLEQDLNIIERENVKIFRQENVYDTQFDQFMLKHLTKLVSDFKKEKHEHLALLPTVLLRHVLNVVPGLAEHKKKDKWFAMLTDLYAADIALVQELIANKDLVPWILNLTTKCPHQNMRCHVLSFFQTIFKDFENKTTNETSVQTLCTKLCEVVRYMSPHDMPFIHTKEGKLLPLAHEVFVLLNSFISKSVYLTHFHQNNLLGELVHLCCKGKTNKPKKKKNNRYIRYQWLPPSIHLLQDKSSLHYDSVFDLIRHLLEHKKKSTPSESKTDESDTNEDDMSSQSEENNPSDETLSEENEHKYDNASAAESGSESPTQPANTDADATAATEDVSAYSLASDRNVYSRAFLQCLAARKCEDAKHQLKLVYLVGENNFAASKKLTECVIRRVENLDNFDCYPAVLCFMELMSIDDELKQKRWDVCFKLFIDCVKKDNFGQSWHMIEMCVVLLLDLMNRTKEVKIISISKNCYLFEFFFSVLLTIFALCHKKTKMVHVVCVCAVELQKRYLNGIEFIDWIQAYAEEFPSLKKLSQLAHDGRDVPKPYKHPIPRDVSKYVPIDKIPFCKGKQGNLKLIIQAALNSANQK
ncbi:hypothetical protein RFI_34281, partial [Reticulomyxa filosa]